MDSFIKLLDPQTLHDAGLHEFHFGYQDQVRFYELDRLEHVNNVVFLRWFETIRVRYVQHFGFTSYSEGDPMMVVRRVTADYLAPMFFEDTYVVAARTRLIRPSSFVMDYAVATNGTINATGEAVVVSLEQDGKTRRPHAPEAVKAVVENDGASWQP